MSPDVRRDLWAWVAWRAERSPSRPLAFDEHDRRLDFGGLYARAERVAAGLVEAGVRPGSRVVWILPTRLEALILTAALARIGCQQVPIMPSYGRRELAFVLAQARPDHVLVGPPWRGTDHAALVRELLAESRPPDTSDTRQTSADRALIVADPALPEASPELLPPPTSPSDDPVRWIFYTSGTTSEPKGALHGDGSLLASAIALDAPHRFHEDDRVSLVFPYAHIGGPSLLFSALRVGHALILVEAFDLEVVTRTLSRHGVTLAGSGPVFWQAYLAAQRAQPDRPLFPRLRALIGGGAAKPAHLHAEAKEVLGVPILSGYGSTECPGLAYNHLGDAEDVLASDGRAVESVEIRIVRPDGALAGPDEEGEICVRGAMLFRGYLGADESPFDEAGFFATGDLGRLDASGSLRVTGRIKDVIIRKGETLGAKEIEDVLGADPLIAEVAVIGLPDAERGERCCAVVVPARGAGSLSLADIQARCAREGLMRTKHPEQLEQLDALPRNSTGKVLKDELRRRFGVVAKDGWPRDEPIGADGSVNAERDAREGSRR